MMVPAKATTRVHLALILILVGVMATPAPRADAASSRLDPGPRFKVESDVVRVPVVVIDKEGRLYTDLKKEQFKTNFIAKAPQVMSKMFQSVWASASIERKRSSPTAAIRVADPTAT